MTSNTFGKHMESDHPFQDLFETFGRMPVSHAEEVNKEAYELLRGILDVPLSRTGRNILLRAPRAGHGKTHMLSRLQNDMVATHEFVPLQASLGCRVDAATVIDDTLRRLFRPLPASGGLCMLDLISRRLFALSLQTLVASGEVPCQDREGALMALRNRPIETFDFHHQNAVTAKWVRDNFAILGQRMGLDLANRCNLPLREVAFWTEALFRFSATPPENPLRMRVLIESVYAGTPGESVMADRLQALLGLLSLLMRVVLVADDLEGFSSDEASALRFSAFIGSMRHAVNQVDIIVSVNRDVWDNAFLPRLSGGLADRMSEVVVELKPLEKAGMIALLESRVPGLGEAVYNKLDTESVGNHARGIIQAAAVAWIEASERDKEQLSDHGSLSSEPFAAAPAAVPSSEVPPHEATTSTDAAPPVDPDSASTTEASVSAANDELPDLEPSTLVPEPAITPALHDSQAADPAPAMSESPYTKADQPEDTWPHQDFATFQPTTQSPSAADSPFQLAAEPAAHPAELAAPIDEPSRPPGFDNEPVSSASPFSIASDSARTMADVAPAQSAVDHPPMEQAAQDDRFTSKVSESPFQIAGPPNSRGQDFIPSTHHEPTPGPQPAVEFVPTPNQAPAFATPYGSSQAQQFHPAESFSPAPAVSPPQPPAQASPPAPAAETDRVDDLLRQFRERYGKGNG